MDKNEADEVEIEKEIYICQIVLVYPTTPYQMMKISKDSAPFLVILLAFVCFSFLLFDQEDVVVIFDVQSAVVDKNKPILVLAAMNKGEFLKINYGLAAGSPGVVSDVSVRVTDMRGGEIRSMKTGASLRADNTANFKIEISAPKYLKLDIKASKTGDEDVEASGKRDLLKLSKCFIDEKKSGKPNFKQTLRLKAGDQLSIASSDPKAAVLTCYLPRTGATYSVKEKPVIDIEDDGNYALEFYVDRGSVSVLKRAKEGVGLDSKDFYFSDLTVSRIRPADPDKAAPQVGSEKQVAKKEEFNQAQMEESAKKQNNERMEQARQEKEADRKFREDLLALARPKIDTVIVAQTGTTVTVSMDVPAQLNYMVSNRVFRELEISGTAQYWVFWIGTGQNAERAFRDKDVETKDSRDDRRGIFWIFANKVLKGQTTSFSSLFPDLQGGEDIEFAVVDELNKERFMRGEPCIPYSPVTAQVNTTSSYGFATMPMSNEKLFLCVSNNNRISQVHISFQYSLVELEQKINGL